MASSTNEMNPFATKEVPKGNIIEAVRSSCHAFVEKSPIKISQKGIEDFLTKLDKLEYEELAYDSTIKMPLRFETVEDELNFITLIDLLNFGSGYRVPLHELTGRGAFDTIRFGAMYFHIGGKPMTAETFKNTTIFDVAEMFQIPIDREVRHEKLDFVTMTEPTPLKPFAAGLTTVLNTTGEYLLANNYKDLAHFILTHVKENPQNAVSLVEHFVRAFPGLADCYQFSEESDDLVYIYKKAQIIVYHLWFTFKEQLPELFDFKDIDTLTIFSDNVIPTMLAHLGIIEMPETWQQDIVNHLELDVQTATTLRAAAIVACDEIVRMARSGVGSTHNMTTGGLDVYLWRLGKVGDYRKVPRLQLRDTVMF
ncbi:uncharacterized protein BX663DRAFT_503823 [Cokeromyces recurvatus]|uniref:uncharacterized protein n=1 Tax=Cokeromyces recurvatus TaxID=90255 RepID=UPI00221E397B|nr:uncharacterized protein BX663DRAFT_503823 [Cokeromyces recurvatus]KAI7904860.1 hypothetical protein BX663DRAFT_503823 [Cokeromyces recurvatus]